MNNTDPIEEKKKYWLDEYWPELQKAAFDSEEKQEKYVFTISTGAVGLLLGTMGFGNKSYGIGFALIALGLFTVSMMLCVIYHIIAKRNHNNQFRMIENFLSNPENGDSELRGKICLSNNSLDWISIFSVILILIGIFLFAIFLFKNL